MRSSLCFVPAAIVLGLLLPDVLKAQEDEAAVMLPINGRIADGVNKMEGCVVLTFKGNERVDSTVTDKSGKFHTVLALNETYGIEFRKNGFVAKRMVLDTHVPKLKDDQEIIIGPISMDISLLERSKYVGASTDELDFPFALVKFNKRELAFTPDEEYTASMQRTNGALLLMAGRSTRKN